MTLASSPCRDLCDWVATRGSTSAAPLLACRGCGTQWERGLGWTPQQADGTVPDPVLTLLRSPTPNPPPAAAVGTPGS